MKVLHKTNNGVAHGLKYLTRGMALTGLALWEVVLLIWFGVAVSLLVVGVGVYLVPGALLAIQREAKLQRSLAGRWSGVTVSGLTPRPPPEGGLRARWRWCVESLADPTTRRELLWTLVNPFVGPFTSFTPSLAVIHGIWGIVLLGLWRPVVSHWDNSWYLFIPLRGEQTAALSAVLGLIEIGVGLWLAAPLTRQHGRWVGLVLGRPKGAELRERVAHLSKSRSDNVDRQSGEIRRIERDLHDGAQSRLVAMGMTLAAAEQLLEANPDAARALLIEARNSSAQALMELRELVRGIHPPVLADRGLLDALRSRALDSPVAVEVTGDLPGSRLPAALEAAVYFATSELLTNVTKHAQAHHAVIKVCRRDQTLRVTVRDDGVGGASVLGGSGLRGIEERLAAFDGILRLVSPTGGPTVAVVEVPCPQLP